MDFAEITYRIITAGAIALLRLPESRAVIPTAEAILQGGVTVLEITLTTPGATSAIKQLSGQLPQHTILGAGSILSLDDVARSVDCGAKFIVSPITTPQIIECAHDHGLPIVAGALTPNEIFHAQEMGSDLVKVFPAGFWGPRYIKAVLAPMPHLRLCPTGGVTPENAGQWIQAGAKVVGVGSALADPVTVAAGNYAEITRRARRLVKSVDEVHA